MNFPLTCPHCKKEIEIVVEIESPSDYYYDKECPECNKKIEKYDKNKDLDIEIMEEVSEYEIGKKEYYRDLKE